MTIDDTDATVEKAVQVTLPNEETVTEIELNDKDVKVAEETARVEPVADKNAGKQVDARQQALEDLKRQYEQQKRIAEAERDARRKAEEFARHQTMTAHQAGAQVQDSNLRIIENAISTTEATAAQAERAYAEAMAAGDYALAAKAQRALAQAESHLLQLENGRSRLKEQLQELSEGAQKAPEIPSFAPQIPQDPLEIYASKLTPKSAEWLRAHPDAVEKIGRLTRAHEDALEDGLVPESREYFSYIESRLGYSSRDEQPSRQAAPAPTPRKNMASAPVSSPGYTSSSSSESSNTMTLTPSEVEVALLMEPELPRNKAIEAYARNKALLIKQGKLTA